MFTIMMIVGINGGIGEYLHSREQSGLWVAMSKKKRRARWV
jgi:hypothetical protein